MKLQNDLEGGVTMACKGKGGKKGGCKTKKGGGCKK